jgi:hypothetical protein
MTKEQLDNLIKEAAVSVFVCDEDDKTLLDQYNLIMETDEDEPASNVVIIWEPFDQWDIGRIQQAVLDHESYIRRTINTILNTPITK